MKALQLTAIGKIELVDIPVPEIQPGYLLIKTGAATICTSDINDKRSNPFGIPLPVILGHEAAGTVAGIGAQVSGFQIGDPVATHPVHPCGSCAACQSGMRHLCLEMLHFGLNMQGTMAEYYLVRQDRAIRVPPLLDFALVSLAEPVSVCLEALAQARLHPGGKLLIVGDGPFGVLMSHLAQSLELAKVVLVGRQDFRLSFAAPEVRFNDLRMTKPLETIQSLAGGQGFDAAILAVGSPEAFSTCLQCLHSKGRLVVFSALPGETPVDLFSVHLKELEIIGACNDQDRFAEAVRLISSEPQGIVSLITHRFPLEAFEQAFHMAEHEQDQAMKVSFVW